MSAGTARQEVCFFDIMGTVLDWKSSILPALRSAPPTPALAESALPALADAWRLGFFAEIHRMFQEDSTRAPESIDVTHRRVLDRLLKERGVSSDVWPEEVREKLVQSWHYQTAWLDSIEGIGRLKKKYFVCGLANGTTRLQLDITSSSGVAFHGLFSSQLLGLTKPDPRIYLKALELVDVPPSNATMIAAHAYDLRAAKKVGMKTIYIYRTTEDLDEDMDALRTEFDHFIDGTTGDGSGGLVALAEYLGA